MRLSIKTLLLGVAAFVMIGCGGSSSGPSNTSKTITGLALKADGTAFGASAKVLAVDQNGNVAEGQVDANGKYTVTLTGVASSGKKSKLIDGNSFLQVSDGTDTMNLVVAEDETKINFNAITSASSALLVGTSADLSAVFAAAESAKKGKEITNASVLLALAKVQAITKDLFKDSGNSVIGALFGFDSDGKPAFSIDKLLNGDANAKEVTLIKAASDALGGDLTSLATARAQDPNPTSFLLNDPSYFEALGKEIAKGSNVSTKAFSDLLNTTLGNEFKDALKELADTLNDYVAAVIAEPTAVLEATIPQTATSAPKVIVTVTRSDDSVTYSLSGALDNDKTDLAVSIISDTAVEAVISVSLQTNGTSLVAGDAKIIVTTGTVSVTVKGTKALDTSGSIDLAVALAEATKALTDAKQTDLAAKIPTSTAGFDLSISSAPVSRSGKNVSTFITYGSTTVTSTFGVVLQ